MESQVQIPISLVQMPARKTSLAHAERMRANDSSRSLEVVRRTKSRLWIDLDNSPHVPLFLPIINELEKRGIELVITARNMYQVCELIDFFKLPCRVVGGHWGKNKILKVLCNCVRVAQLVPIIRRERPHLAISHGSRSSGPRMQALGYSHDHDARLRAQHQDRLHRGGLGPNARCDSGEIDEQEA